MNELIKFLKEFSLQCIGIGIFFGIILIGLNYSIGDYPQNKILEYLGWFILFLCSGWGTTLFFGILIGISNTIPEDTKNKIKKSSTKEKKEEECPESWGEKRLTLMYYKNKLKNYYVNLSNGNDWEKIQNGEPLEKYSSYSNGEVIIFQFNFDFKNHIKITGDLTTHNHVYYEGKISDFQRRNRTTLLQNRKCIKLPDGKYEYRTIFDPINSSEQKD
jgi:hypothetical protein